MKNSGLMDDDSVSMPTIIEIPLKQLTVNVELGSSALKLDTLGESLMVDRKSSFPGTDSHEAPGISSNESSSPDSDDSLLEESRSASNKSLPDTYRSSSSVLHLQTLKSSPSTSSRRGQRLSREHRRRRHRHSLGANSSSVPDASNSQDSMVMVDVTSDFTNHTSEHTRSLSVDHSSSPILALNSPPNNTRHRLSSGSSLPSASLVNELSPRCKPKQGSALKVANSTAGHVRFVERFPNNFLRPSPRLDRGDQRNVGDINGEDNADEKNVLCEEQTPNVLGDNPHFLMTVSDDSHNMTGAGASASNYSNKALLPKTSNISLAHSLLHKTRSYQDHLCSAADSAQAEASIVPFCLDAVTKEELLVLWKSSEIELNKRLEAALKEKSRLERKLAMLQKHSVV